MYTKQPFSEYISTRWYRAPECLLTDGYYNYKMDIWGLGCVFFELMMLFPLFPGDDELDQINRIHQILGSPSQEILSKFKKSEHLDFDFQYQEGSGIEQLMGGPPPLLLDLLMNMLAYDPDERFNARQCLRHPYFMELRDADKKSSELNRQQKTHISVSPQISIAPTHPSIISTDVVNRTSLNNNNNKQQTDQNGSISLPRIILSNYNSSQPQTSSNDSNEDRQILPSFNSSKQEFTSPTKQQQIKNSNPSIISQITPSEKKIANPNLLPDINQTTISNRDPNSKS